MRGMTHTLRSPASLLAALTLLGAACGPGAAPAAPTTAPAAAPTAAPAAKPTTAPAAPQAIPADAAPPDQQVLVLAYDNTADFTTLDFWQSVYGRGGATSDLMTEPLVRLNKNFELVPAAADKWSVDSTN